MRTKSRGYIEYHRRAERRGFLVLDVVLALALGALFIFILASSSSTSSEAINRSRARSELLDVYEAGLASTTIEQYGNDRIRYVYTVKDDNGLSIQFDEVKLKDDFHQTFFTRPDALCAINFGPNLTTNIIHLPIPTGIPLTHVEVRNGFAYISTDSSKATDPDLYIVDIRSPDLPNIVSSINTGPGIASFAIVGKYIFAAAASTAAQLHIIDLGVAHTLSLAGKYQLPLPYATATPPFATAISFGGNTTYSSNTIYIGTEKWSGSELSAVDVTNVLAPRFLSGFEIGNKVNDIYIRDDIAYVSSAGEDQLRIFDIKNPNTLNLLATLSPSGWSRQEGKVFSSFEGNSVFGRTSGGYDISIDHELFSWASSSDATSISLPNALYTKNIPTGVYGIIQDKERMYVATREPGKEIQIISNFSATSSPASTPVTLSLNDQPQYMTCDRSKIYVLSHNSPILYEIN